MKFMRLIVMFDLPVKTKKQSKEATAFRNFLLKDGFYMVQSYHLEKLNKNLILGQY